MPIHRGFDSQGCYYRYGDTGKPYHYKCGDEQARQRAYDKAREQEIAIGIYDSNLIETITMKKWRSAPSSSNVDRIMYDDETRDLVIKFNDGAYYTYYDIDFTEFVEVFNGAGICRTSGTNRWGTWFVGKTPSVGAAVYDILVRSGKRYTKGGSLR
jgi:hypothetical protein